MRNVELAMRLAFIKEHETRRSPTDRREKSVQIGEICGSKNQALNALEKTSGRKRPRIANAMRGVFIKEHESPMRPAP